MHMNASYNRQRVSSDAKFGLNKLVQDIAGCPLFVITKVVDHWVYRVPGLTYYLPRSEATSTVQVLVLERGIRTTDNYDLHVYTLTFPLTCERAMTEVDAMNLINRVVHEYLVNDALHAIRVASEPK